MKIEDKISIIADWIVNESDSRSDEVEWLLYGLYGVDKSGLSTDIDEAYGDVIKLMSGEEE